MDVIILHGIMSEPGAHWQSWLARELETRGHRVSTPLLPQADHPDRFGWLDVIEETAGELDPHDLVIVGHSLGVTSALDYIEKCDGGIKGLVSVAGFGRDYGSDLNSYFLRSRDIDFSRLKQNLQKGIVLYGDNDPYVTQDALQQLAVDLDTEPVVIPNGGHLNSEAGFTTFPAVLEAVQSLT